MNTFFITVTDATDGKTILIRGDLIFKVEECEPSFHRTNRRIVFVEGKSEYVTDTIEDIITKLEGATCTRVSQ